MAGKREKPEEIVSKLREVEVLQGQGMTIADAVRQIGVTQQKFYRCCKLYGGMGRSQVKRLKELEKENQRLKKIIAELEPTARGAYCGSLGYIGFDGTMDLSILIRTITAGGGWWQIPVGGGIVSQSTASGEYEETWHKAQGILQALV